jgi:hypothetical protein
MPHRKRIARPSDTLTLEACLFSILMAMALVGAVFDSGIHRILSAQGLAASWGFAVGSVGVLGFCVAATEWYVGLNWNDHRMRGACFLRLWCNLLGIIIWGYLAHSIYFYSDFSKAVFPLVLGPVCVAFHGFCCFILRREEVILDPKKDTVKLEAQIDRRRLA